MQNYAITENDIIIKFPADPVRENPNTSFAFGWQGGTVNGINYVLVEIDNAPEIDPLTQDATPQTPQKINGKWVQKYSVVTVSAPEQQRRKAEKARRDQEQADSFLTPDEIRAVRKLLKQG
jgi:hypothetical protein